MTTAFLVVVSPINAYMLGLNICMKDISVWEENRLVLGLV